jgi:hypothetical protein
MSSIVQSAHSTQAELTSPPNSLLDTAQGLISRLSSDRLERILNENEPPVPSPGPDLAFVFPLAKIRHKEFFREKKDHVTDEVRADLERWVIGRDETPAEWINRNRPLGVPEISGDPYWSDEDGAWCWEAKNWSIFMTRHPEGALSVTWAELGACFWYVLSNWGDRKIEGGEWDTAI